MLKCIRSNSSSSLLTSLTSTSTSSYPNLLIDSNNQVISGNRRFESIKRLGWKEVEVEVKEVKKEEEELLLIHFNKQRIKSFKELINEYLILDNLYRKGQGKPRHPLCLLSVYE